MQKQLPLILPPASLFADRWLHAALLLGLAGFFFPAHPDMLPLWKIVGLALAEETVFRAGLQAFFEKKTSRHMGPLSLGNVAASAVFALTHLVTAPFWGAMSVFFPSLLLGILWSRHRSIILCGSIHSYFNILYYL